MIDHQLFTIYCINLNILECKSNLSLAFRTFMRGINLNILECKFYTRNLKEQKVFSINLNILECKFCCT